MYNKKFIVLVCLALVSGLLVGLLSFHDEFEVSSSKLYAEVNILYAYFQVLNVSRDSGVVYERMVSSVVVLNITNPTETIFEIRELRMSLSPVEDEPTLSYVFYSYYNDFESGHPEYYWRPGESRLVAFSLTNGIGDGENKVLNSLEGDFSLELCHSGLGEPDYGRARISQKLQLKALNNNEFVYGDYFNADRQFGFDNSMIDIMGPAIR